MTLHPQAAARQGFRFDWRRIGGTAAAVGVLLGLPVIPTVLMGGPYKLLAIPALAVVAALGAVAVRLLWDDVPFRSAIRLVLTAAIAAAIALPVMWFGLYLFTLAYDLCGYRGEFDPVLLAAPPVYLGLGLWGFQRPKRLLWAWPLAIVVAFGLWGAIDAALPAAHGFCES